MSKPRQIKPLRDWVAEYLKSDASEQRSILEFLRDKEPYLFAHHPADDRFRSHVWHLGGFYWCKGCLMSASGFLLGLVCQLALGWMASISDLGMAVILIAMLLPTAVTARFHAPYWFKHSARLLLGAAVASSSLYLFVTDSWLARATIVVSFFAIREPLARYRKKLNQRILDN